MPSQQRQSTEGKLQSVDETRMRVGELEDVVSYHKASYADPASMNLIARHLSGVCSAQFWLRVMIMLSAGCAPLHNFSLSYSEQHISKQYACECI